MLITHVRDTNGPPATHVQLRQHMTSFHKVPAASYEHALPAQHIYQEPWKPLAAIIIRSTHNCQASDLIFKQ